MVLKWWNCVDILLVEDPSMLLPFPIISIVLDEASPMSLTFMMEFVLGVDGNVISSPEFHPASDVLTKTKCSTPIPGAAIEAAAATI